MPKNESRTLRAYAMHGLIEPGAEDERATDYEQLAVALVRASFEGVQTKVSGDIVSITSAHERDGDYFLRFVSADKNADVLLFEPESNTENEFEPASGRMVAYGVWVCVRPSLRSLVIESKRPTVRLAHIEKYIQRVAIHEFRNDAIRFSLNQITSDEFRQEVDRFQRIREVEIRLQRPNNSWRETGMSLVDLAPASNADSVFLGVKAARGKSLSKTDGIVPELVDESERPHGEVTDAVVVGTKYGEDKESSAKLSDSALRGTAHVPSTANSIEELDHLESPMRKLTDAIAARVDRLRKRRIVGGTVEDEETHDASR